MNGVEGPFKIDENYTVDKAIININRPATRSINKCVNSTILRSKSILTVA